MIQINPLALCSLRLGSESSPAEITDMISALPQCRNLRELSLEGSQITDEYLSGLEGLADFQFLDELTLYQTALTPAGISSLLGVVKDCLLLRRLNIVMGNVDDSCMEALSCVKRISELNLSLNRAITDTGFAQLSSLFNLEKLYLGNTDVGDEGMRAIAQLPELRILSLERSRALTTQGLMNLSASLSLEKLSLTRMSNELNAHEGEESAGVEALARLPRLSTLRVVESTIGAYDLLPFLEQFGSLRQLLAVVGDADLHLFESRNSKVTVLPVQVLGCTH